MNSTWSTVGDVMTHAVVAVGRDADFREITDTLQQWQVSAVPVLTGDGRVIGVVSEADLLTAQDREPGTFQGMTAGAMMTTPAVTVHPDSPIAEAGRSMARMHLKRLPVVDAEDCLVGIVSRGDLLKVHLREDGELVGQVRFELIAALRPADASGLEAQADDGRITLTGSLPDTAMAALLEHLVKGVPGVVDAQVRLGVPA
ncbi:CBS domain-containing protein [Kitasatospora sp. NPDC085879]|uniref:CBS domain-containing protein n=1 Tax=Kitasatospora sp. NPDC085879 TaxID=3154769 RepID=UPI00342D42CD